MYKVLAETIVHYFIKHHIIEENKKDIYEYSFEVLLATVVFSVIYFIISFFTSLVIESVFFIIGFFIVRTISGGYHADSYLKCHLLTLANHILFVIVLKISHSNIQYIITISLLLLSAIGIFIFAPIDHPNKPFKYNEKQRFKKMSQLYSLVLAICIIPTMILPSDIIIYAFCFSLGTFSATCALLSANIKKKGS